MRGFWVIVFMISPASLLINENNMYNIQSVAIIAAALPTMLMIALIVVSFYKKVRKKS